MNILREELKLFPFRLQKGQHIPNTDKENRVYFKTHFHTQLLHNLAFLKCIVLSYGCSFSFSLAVNKQAVESGAERARNRYNNSRRVANSLWFGVHYPNKK